MTDVAHELRLSDDDGDTLIVTAFSCSLEVRTLRGRAVVLDHDATQQLRTFLLHHLPPAGD